jgi:putative FmdB family regulatory protein
MPIYEYRCDEDGHTFEVLQRFSDEPVSTCQVCGAPVRRVFHPVAVHFKGSGFYNTDYGTRKRAREMSEAKGDGKSDGAKDTSSEAKTSETKDSKPAKSETGAKKAEAKSAAGD